MMKYYLIAVALLITCSSYAQKEKDMNTSRAEDEVQIRTVTGQLIQWMIERDTLAMSGIVDENFTLTHITGYVQPKKEWFTEIERESMKYYSAKEVNSTIKINGNRASFMTQNQVDARIWASRNTWRLQQDMQLEKRNGNWIILSSVAKTF